MGDSMVSILFFGLMFVVMYFFMIRPQMQRQKKEKNFQENLNKGTLVVTTSGIHGRVADIQGDIVLLDVGAGKIRIEKSGISRELSLARYKDKNETK